MFKNKRKGGKNGGGRGAGTAAPDTRGLRVPLPLLFLGLMLLVLVSAFDLAGRAVDADQTANREVAKVLINAAIDKADRQLDDLARRLAMLPAEAGAVSDFSIGGPEAMRQVRAGDILRIYTDGSGNARLAFAGDAMGDAEALLAIHPPGATLNGVGEPLGFGAGATPRFAAYGGTVYVLSRPVPAGASLPGVLKTNIVAGLPAEELLLAELRRFETFRVGELGLAAHAVQPAEFRDLSALIAELQREKIGEIQPAALAQLVIVLVAFIICALIGQHIDETNNRLRRSYDALALGKQAERAARRMALSDPLTRVANRRAFDRALSASVAEADAMGSGFVLVLLDLDDFKPVNDSLGHQAGDETLKVVAAGIKECVRGSDLVARIGGDEFAVILRDLTDTSIAARLTDRIVRGLSQPMQAGEYIVHIGISAGLAVYPDDADSAEELIEVADGALYEAKSGGKNQLRVAAG